MKFESLHFRYDQYANEQSALLRNTAAGIGAGAFAFVCASAFASFDMQSIVGPKIVKSLDQTNCSPQPSALKIIDANIHGNSEFLQKLITTHHANLAVAQEVNGDTINKIVKPLNCATLYYGPTDYLVGFFNGGQGNTIVSVGLEDKGYEIQQFYETFSVSKFLSHLIQFDKDAINKARKERRGAIVSRYQVPISNVTVPVNILNTHIDGDSAGERQLREVMEFAEKEMSDDNSINIIMGDFNRTPSQLRRDLIALKTHWVVEDIGPTSQDGRQIDHFLHKETFSSGDQIYKLVVNSTVLPDKGSDHKAFISSVRLKPLGIAVVQSSNIIVKSK